MITTKILWVRESEIVLEFSKCAVGYETDVDLTDWVYYVDDISDIFDISGGPVEILFGWILT